MSRYSKWLSIFLIIGSAAILISGCNDGGISSLFDPSTRVYLISAGNGTLVPDQEENSYFLTLNHVSSNVRWYTDRPERLSGTETMGHYINYTWPNAYGFVAPNLTLQLYNAVSDKPGIWLAMVNERAYDPETDTLTFRISILNTVLYPPPTEAISFRKSFITVLNNAKRQRRSSSFVLNAGEVSLTRADQKETYTLSLENVKGVLGDQCTDALFSCRSRGYLFGILEPSFPKRPAQRFDQRYHTKRRLGCQSDEAEQPVL